MNSKRGDELDGKVLAVNVGGVREVQLEGRTITTAIWKFPVEGRLALRGVNVQGDDQADREAHGGYDKAVYCYASEDTRLWQQQLGRELGPGSFGENLTLANIDVTGARVGERWRVGSALLEVSEPRVPCFKLGLRMRDARFPKRFAGAGRPGAYLRIIEEGDVGAGDGVTVEHRPDHDVTVGLVSWAYLRDHAQAARLLEARELSAAWKAWATKQLRKRAAAQDGQELPPEAPA